MEATLQSGYLVKSVSIENMLNQRQAVIDRVAHAKKLIIEAVEIATAAHLHKYGTFLGDRYEQQPIDMMNPSADDVKKRLDYNGWNHLLSESGLKSLMDADARKKWDSNMQSGEFPELTIENINNTFRNLHASRKDMFERGVINCFRRLSWDYKTNSPFRLGKRIILSWFYNGWGVVSSGCDSVDDLLRVMHILDNVPEPDHRQGTYATCCNQEISKSFFFENDYISLRWYKKGTAHITFKRPDLVEEMNRIIAKHYPGALPQARAGRSGPV